MLIINNKADYGLILISELINKDEYISLSKLVAVTNLPQRFIARIASDLSKSGILQSKEGKDGGYKLVKKLKDVTLFDFLNIFDQNAKIVKCQKDKFSCNYGKLCNHKFFFREVLNKIFIKELKNWTLDDLLKINSNQ